MNSFEVRIENPCGEDLSKMKPTQRGRFCGACKRDLVDFTKLPDQEIVKIFHQTNGDVCGWFRPDQLERPLAVQQEVSSPNYLKYAASMLLTMALGNSLAQDSTNTVSNEVIELQEVSPPVVTKPFLISGTVTDAVNGEALIMATVRIDSTTYGVNVDFDGNFVLEIPKEFRKKDVKLRVNYLGYDDFTMTLKQESLESGCQELKLQLNPTTLGEVQIIARVEKIEHYEALAGVPVVYPREQPIGYFEIKKIRWWQFRKKANAKKRNVIKHCD